MKILRKLLTKAPITETCPIKFIENFTIALTELEAFMWTEFYVFLY